MILWCEDPAGRGIAVEVDGRPLALLCAAEGCTDTVTRRGGALVWRRRCNRPADRMEMTLKTAFAPLHTMVPAVSYDGNAFGSDHEYKGYSFAGTPYTFAWHRTAVPAATASWNGRDGIALCTLEQNTAGGLVLHRDFCEHRVLWPETEQPRVLHAMGWGDAFIGAMKPKTTFTALVYVGGDAQPAWQAMLSDVWEKQYAYKAPGMPAKTLWEYSVAYAKTLFTREADGFCGFNIGLAWDGKAWAKREKNKYEIGWCGQNASLAVSLLYHALHYRDEAAGRMGYQVLDSWLRLARSPQGLLLTRRDSADLPIDAVNLGNAACQYFEAGQISKRLGEPKPAYSQAALEICRFAMERQQASGCIGVSWRQDGTILLAEGTAGGFLVPPLAQAFIRTGDTLYLDAAVRAFSYYYDEFRLNGYGTAGALDTYCIDKESVIPLLQGALLLYRGTGEEAYLRYAREAAWYLSTWQWHHRVSYPAGSILRQLRYDTFGGTAVSTSHQHLDNYALSYVPDLLELGELTHERQWTQRALAIWRNGVQCVSDGTLGILGKTPRPKGSQDEGYFHTRWGFSPERHGYFTVSQWLVAWPNAFRLLVLRGKPDNETGEFPVEPGPAA